MLSMLTAGSMAKSSAESSLRWPCLLGGYPDGLPIVPWTEVDGSNDQHKILIAWAVEKDSTFSERIAEMDSKRKTDEDTAKRKRAERKALTIAGTSESGSEQPDQEDDGAGPSNVRDNRTRKKQEYNIGELEVAFESCNAAPGGFKRNAHHLLNQLGGKTTTLRKALRDANLKWGQPTGKQAERMLEAYSQRIRDGDTVQNALKMVAENVPGGWCSSRTIYVCRYTPSTSREAFAALNYYSWRPWQVRKILKERGVDIPDGRRKHQGNAVVYDHGDISGNDTPDKICTDSDDYSLFNSDKDLSDVIVGEVAQPSEDEAVDHRVAGAMVRSGRGGTRAAYHRGAAPDAGVIDGGQPSEDEAVDRRVAGAMVPSGRGGTRAAYHRGAAPDAGVIDGGQPSEDEAEDRRAAGAMVRSGRGGTRAAYHRGAAPDAGVIDGGQPSEDEAEDRRAAGAMVRSGRGGTRAAYHRGAAPDAGVIDGGQPSEDEAVDRRVAGAMVPSGRGGTRAAYHRGAAPDAGVIDGGQPSEDEAEDRRAAGAMVRSGRGGTRAAYHRGAAPDAGVIDGGQPSDHEAEDRRVAGAMVRSGRGGTRAAYHRGAAPDAGVIDGGQPSEDEAVDRRVAEAMVPSGRGGTDVGVVEGGPIGNVEERHVNVEGRLGRMGKASKYAMIIASLKRRGC
ncbi:hypothetical protein Vretimale_6331 [Volvox reticuliferus]|uniref:Uncharacterized protein n=2 Tax=Volvox reticuliferus TaxID=1737510 RepID=A0A8J4G7B2_9CHLO|nr:hypothetical protein Vretifemale_15919 [Volvox reticuliferus]GIM01544.1 hypothetical protein Vretimale_6331 [Volvox reticuliferus]